MQRPRNKSTEHTCVGGVTIQFCHRHACTYIRTYIYMGYLPPTLRACMHATPSLHHLSRWCCRRRTAARTPSCSRREPPRDLEQSIQRPALSSAANTYTPFLKHLSATLMRWGTANKATNFLVTVFWITYIYYWSTHVRWPIHPIRCIALRVAYV